MRIVVDANVVVSAILGRSDPIAGVVARAIPLFIPEAQLDESVKIVRRLGDLDIAASRELVSAATDRMVYVQMIDLAGTEQAARARLGPRGQPDWPVLAAAMLLEAHIWSRDRDFFGVGVPVWSTRNIGFAFPQGTQNA